MYKTNQSQPLRESYSEPRILESKVTDMKRDREQESKNDKTRFYDTHRNYLAANYCIWYIEKSNREAVIENAITDV